MSTRVGPRVSSEVMMATKVDPKSAKPKLDVVIPVFDPGIPEDDFELDDEEEIWPELRRAEAVRFALNLKEKLEETGKFGAVRVTPNAEANGDLYVLGRIVESNGLDVEISVDVYDISGAKWYDEDYDHEVPEKFFKSIRNKGVDPYDPVFIEAANDLVEHLDDADGTELALLKPVTEMRFGANFSEEAFSEYIREEDGEIELTGLPSEDDPMLRRIRAIWVRDQLYVDNLQQHYEAFDANMGPSYAVWQQQNQETQIALNEARVKQTTQIVGGVLLAILGVGLAVASGNSGNYGRSSGALAGAAVAGVGSAVLFSEGFKTGNETKFHANTLEELGESVDAELAPQVVEFEGETKKLTGNAAKQFAEWREFLKQIYEQEKTPEKQL
ncbi:hypothetical protein [Sneathiella litorea]|uniref:Uncharacterized protein n=1 Tax=Sneathiella litorea TaxID=2606216 RepID=A0A6L8WBC2_9PROT|nr:hypothetical protein [Sneathiella litorea]MZR32365.1 hypothetical protein [Sneathiella litorea]